MTVARHTFEPNNEGVTSEVNTIGDPDNEDDHNNAAAVDNNDSAEGEELLITDRDASLSDEG
ncbi:hypothetical protein MMC26_002839 [Xylographa opegraphella]|nr:hypothetical protein [Xylographa opegraphella]